MLEDKEELWDRCVSSALTLIDISMVLSAAAMNIQIGKGGGRLVAEELQLHMLAIY